MKSFLTLAGARRYRRSVGGQIIRIACDPVEIYVVTPSWRATVIYDLGDDGRVSGSIRLPELSARATGAGE